MEILPLNSNPTSRPHDPLNFSKKRKTDVYGLYEQDKSMKEAR